MYQTYFILEWHSTFFDVLMTVLLSIFISVINQLDAQNVGFTISLFHASTCFEHMCSKHVEAWNKLIVKQKFCVSSWLITEIKTLYMFRTVFRPLSGVQDCTYSNGHLSNRYCCLLASKQTAVSVWLLYVQSWTPGQKTVRNMWSVIPK